MGKHAGGSACRNAAKSIMLGDAFVAQPMWVSDLRNSCAVFLRPFVPWNCSDHAPQQVCCRRSCFSWSSQAIPAQIFCISCTPDPGSSLTVESICRLDHGMAVYLCMLQQPSADFHNSTPCLKSRCMRLLWTQPLMDSMCHVSVRLPGARMLC